MLLVSMATMLGTSELMTEDLNRKQESENSEGKERKKIKTFQQMTSFQGVFSGISL